MAKVIKMDEENSEKPELLYKAIDPKARENQLINYAEDLAEQKLRDGTASSQLICHYLKLRTEREQLEKERIQHENELLIAKRESLESTARSEKLLEEAIQAFGSYTGTKYSEDEDNDN